MRIHNYLLVQVEFFYFLIDLFRILLNLAAISTTTRVLSVWLCVAFTVDRWIS
jgi:hypothetical protein